MRVEYGRAITGPRSPARYGHKSAIPLSVARRLIEDFEEANRDIPYAIHEDRVVLFVGPELDVDSPVGNYAWYLDLGYVGKHRAPEKVCHVLCDYPIGRHSSRCVT